MPKVSVLMPVYKTNPQYLKEAVDSILEQTFTDFEFLILDDCPSDKTVEERLNKRTLDGVNYSIADYNGYLWMKENVERVPLNLVDFTINVEEELEPQVIRIVESIKKDN